MAEIVVKPVDQCVFVRSRTFTLKISNIDNCNCSFSQETKFASFLAYMIFGIH